MSELHRRPAARRPRAPLPDHPVTIAEAQLLGWSEAARRHALRHGEARRPRRGVLLAPDQDEIARAGARIEQGVLLTARAASLTCARAGVSHHAAAVTYGIPTLGGVLRPCLTVPAGTALRELAGVHLHRATLLDGDVVDVAGFRTLDPARTVLDLAREHGVQAGVVAADHALRTGLVDEQSLVTAFEQCRGWPGRRAGRLTLLLTDGLAESPLESLSRLRMRARGLPAPQPQVLLADRFGRFLGRADFYWDEFGVIGEADGEAKYRDGDETVVGRRRREGWLEDTGLTFVRWGWDDLNPFDIIADRLTRKFADGVPPGSPRRAWQVLGVAPAPFRFAPADVAIARR